MGRQNTTGMNDLLRALGAGAPNAAAFEVRTRWRDSLWQPRADIHQTEDEILIQVEAPGLDEKNLSLHLADDHLIIEGVRHRPGHESPCRCLQMEIEFGPFRRVLPLPPAAEIDAAHIEAHLDAGFLTIRVPRRKPASSAPTRINVN